MDGETQDETASDAASTILPAPASDISEPPVALASALKAIARLNRNTTWVATGLLSSVIFAAVMVAVRDPHPETDDVKNVPQQFKSDLLPNANPAADFSVAGSTEKSAGEITSGQATSVDFGFTLRQIMIVPPCKRSQFRALRRLGRILCEMPARRSPIYGIGHQCDLEMLPLTCGSSPCGAETWCGMKALTVALHRPTGKQSITPNERSMH
jgi:hypothetical protein